MKKTLKAKLTFVRRGAATRLDPRLRMVAAYELVSTYVADQPGTEEFAAARHAALVILQTIGGLNRLLGCFKLPGSDGRELKEQLCSLENELATQADVVAAMTFAEQAVRQMLEEFCAATFDPQTCELKVDVYREGPSSDEEEDDDGEDAAQELRDREYARFKCAALLPTLAELTKTVWQPTQTKMLRRSGSRHG
jgi:hypothetical protein